MKIHPRKGSNNKDSSRIRVQDLLVQAVKAQASDLHLRPGQPAMARVQGTLAPLGPTVLTPYDIQAITDQVLDSKSRKRLQQVSNLDVAYQIDDIGRFRFNFSKSMDHTVISIRLIPVNIPTIHQLNLPKILENICGYRSGLVLIVGATGSGKTTTLASMVRHVSEKFQRHIVTVEDPIEYVYPKSSSWITQKEIGRDEDGYKSAVTNILRQNPDIIVLGELREKSSIEAALTAAQTGHLVLSTLHSMDCAETIHRMLSAFDSHQQSSVRFQLSTVLKAVVSLRLVPSKMAGHLVPAVEVMIVNDRMKKVIGQSERIHEINDIIEESHQSYGMQSFDQSLLQHFTGGLIDKATALHFSSRPGNFDLQLSGLHTMGAQKRWSDFENAAPHTITGTKSLNLTMTKTPGFSKEELRTHTSIPISKSKWPETVANRKSRINPASVSFVVLLILGLIVLFQANFSPAPSGEATFTSYQASPETALAPVYPVAKVSTNPSRVSHWPHSKKSRNSSKLKK